MRAVALACLLAACGADGPPPLPVDDTPLAVDAWREDASGGTTLVERVVARDGVAWSPARTVPDGLTLAPAGESVETLDGRTVTTRRTRPAGAPGRYILDGLCARPASGEPVCASAVFLDLAVPGTETEMADIVEPDALGPDLSGLAVAAVGFALAAVLAFFALMSFLRGRRPSRTAPVPPPEPPHVLALRRWDAVRHDPEIDDFAKALALSEITRAYVEAVLAFPATKWSTTETLAHLGGMTALAEGNVPRVRRLLQATDRVKYAGARPSERFFEDLDADLRGVIDSTRPRVWTDPTQLPEGP